MDGKDYSYSRSIQQWAASTLMFLCLIATGNYLIDPYGLFDSTRISGFNDIKPSASSHVRLTKPYQVARVEPKAVIGGTSRPEMGLDPANSCWPQEYKPVFNMALPGSSVYMQARVLQHAIAVSDTRYVLWGLDFIDFLGKHTELDNATRMTWPPAHQEIEGRLKVSADGSANTDYLYTMLADYSRGMFSLDTLVDSVKTVASQGNRLSSSIHRDGFNPALDYLDIIRWEGQGVLFEQKNSELANMLGRPGIKLHGDKQAWSVQYESVRRLLQYADEYGVDVELFINPYHADYLLAIDRANHWTEFEEWKRQLAKLADEFHVNLWDFSILNKLTIEPPPVSGNTELILKWFWEPAHYRAEYGELMLGKMLKTPCGKVGVSSVGNLITSRNIDEHINRSRTAFLQYKHELVANRSRMNAPDAK